MVAYKGTLAREEAMRAGDVADKQIRGSSLLLVGRGLSLTLNLATQVIIVRYLSTSDYGAWAYGLAFVGFFQAFSSLGLDRGITRFIPIYQERAEYDKLFGTLILALYTIFVVGVIVIGCVFGGSEVLPRLIMKDELSLAVMLVLIFIVPIHGFDELVIGLFASFGNARAIFFRRYVLGPGLKLFVAVLLIAFKGDVVFLAYAYLVANVTGLSLYSAILVRFLHGQGLFDHFRLKGVTIPAKEIFAFTLPLLSSEILTVAMHSTDALMLGYFHGTTEVAAYQVILPLAHMNNVVMLSFSMLYVPLAARLFAHNDFAGINNLYWRTAVWLAIVSFPIFTATFFMAKPITLLLYGSPYESSAIYLQLLALAYYFSAALGLNGTTLKVLGKVVYVLIINGAALVTNVVLNLLLIPRYGALGAAIATAISMVSHNVFKQWGLRMASGINIFNWHYLQFYIVIVANVFGLFLFQLWITNSVYVMLPLGVVVWILVLMLCGKHLKAGETFPELLKFPVIRLLFR